MTDSHQRVSGGLSRWLSGKESPANVGGTRDANSIPESGRSPGEGNGNPLQYSCLRIPWTEEPGRLTVHGVAKSRTWLSTCTHPPQAFPQLLRRTKTANRILWLPLRMKTELGLVHHCIPKMWVRRYFTNFFWMNWYEMSHFFSSDKMLPYILRLIRVIESPLFANKADSSSKQVDGNNLYLEPF